MELFNIRYVVAVAEKGNFTQAAEQCHVGQPALSQQIAKLEGELGLKLFYRDPHSVTLTEAGSEFVQRAREILDKANALEAAMGRYTGLRRGTLDLGLITSLECIDFGDAQLCRHLPIAVENEGFVGYLLQLHLFLTGQRVVFGHRQRKGVLPKLMKFQSRRDAAHWAVEQRHLNAPLAQHIPATRQGLSPTLCAARPIRPPICIWCAAGWESPFCRVRNFIRI